MNSMNPKKELVEILPREIYETRRTTTCVPDYQWNINIIYSPLSPARAALLLCCNSDPIVHTARCNT